MNHRYRLLLLLALAPILMASSYAETPLPKPSAGLSPTEDLGNAALWATRFLTRFHYKRVPLDDAMSGRILDRYLKSLDSEKMIFLASDIAEFGKYRTLLDDAIFDQDLHAPFDMYARFVTRMQERSAYARSLLDAGFQFDVDENWDFERKDASWPASAAEINELWRKRIKNDWLRLKIAGKEAAAIKQTLDKRYRGYGERLADIDNEDIFQSFMNAYTEEIEPHTNYLAPRSSENFNIQMRLSLEGIGAVLQREDEYTAVREVVKGGPADKGGVLKVGDRIVGVGQGETGPVIEVIGWKVDDVVEKIRGKKGTVVRLDVLAGDAGADAKTEQLVIIRERIKLEDQAAKSSMIESADKHHRIGVITLPTFYHDFEGARRGDQDFRSSTRDVAKLIDKLKAEKMDGLVIDLRGNGGGSLSEATDLGGLFIKQGPIVQVKDAQGRISVEEDTDSSIQWQGPLAVVVNRESASASEIFAAAMQDYGRGLIVGETSFGKGTVQNLVDLDNIAQNEAAKYGQLKMTIAQFFRIDGGSTQHKGVVPDVLYPETWDPKDFGESALDNSLPWTQIKAAKYARSGDLHELLPLLTTRHEARVAKDKEFNWWLQDLAEYRKQREQKSLSLLEPARRVERALQDKKREQRKQERIAAGLDDPKVDGKADDGLQADERRIADQAKAEKDDEAKPDFLLTEASRILADAIDLVSADQRLAERVKSVPTAD